jgi:VWFA-related protein
MRVFASVGPILILCCLGLSAVAQQDMVVRVGVTVPRNSEKAVSEIEEQDRLATALNRHKPDKYLQWPVQAVVLEAGWGSHAIAEAKERNCPFIISTQLTSLTTSSKLRPNGATDYDTVPVFAATVEYQLTRAADGTVFATGSAKVEDTTSLQEVVWQTLAEVAGKAIADIGKSGGGLPGESPDARSGEGKLPPGRAETTMIAPSLCAWLPTGIPHADALPGVCEYVNSVAEKMPNFICHQEASRYRGNGRAPTDLISLSVRYEDGNESYSEIKVDGRPATIAAAQATGLWSSGEFGSDNVRSIFDATNQPLFQFDREDAVGERAAWIFTYQIAKQNDPLWRLHVDDQVMAPPYSGELWIDQKAGGVLRFKSIAKDLPKNFAITRVEQQIDYESVAFGDGSSFVLPVDFSIFTIVGREKTRNVVRLTDCHKFRAKGRLVLNAESSAPGAGSTAQIPPGVASLQADLDESEETFSAIQEMTVQESETLRKAEQERMLDAVTAATQQRLTELRGEQQRIQSQRQAIANVANTAAAGDDAPRTRLRVSVRLVPVSVVLRDGNGHAVGNMGEDNFRLFDEGRPQVITQFSVEGTGFVVPAERAGGTVRAQAAVPAETTRSRVTAAERATAYLFDDVHLNLQELAGARDAAARHLGALKAGERAAVFTTSGAVVVDFTEEREKLLASLRQLKPHAILPESDCPPISYYMADLMLNKSDSEATSVAVAEAADCATRGNFPGPHAQHLAAAKALEVLNTGNVESKNVLAILGSVIRRTESMPGQRSIVLVSPGFLALTADTQQDMMEIVDGAARSGIVINTLDAGGLYAGAAGSVGDPVFDSAEAEARSDVMAEFASGTGGIFFHHNNNLDEGFRRTADAPEFVYVLGFSPQKLDGRFHKLKVTLNAAGKFEVQARRGYYAFKPASAN